MKEEMLVGLDHFSEIIFVDRLFSRSIFLFQALLEDFGRGLQVDDEVGRGQLRAEIMVIAVVDFQFLIIEVEAGKNLVLFEDEIGDHGFLRARTQVEGTQLLEASNHEGKLRLKTRSWLALVESAEKRIILRLHDLL